MTGNPGPLGPNSAGMVSETSSATQVLLQHQIAAQHAAQYTADQQAQMIKQWTTPAVQTVSGTNYTMTTTGDTQQVWTKEYEVSKIIKRAKNGYFFVISVDAQDNVFYRVWQGGWFPYVVAKMFKRFGADIDGSMGAWNSVTKRTHLPATLGAAYESIDAAITEDIEFDEHEDYVKDLLTTKPENLKMIGGLEKLAEGDVDAKDDDPALSASVSSNASNTWVAGTGVAAPGGTLSFQNASVQAGTITGAITGVSTLEAKKIVLNGTDLAQVVSDCVKEATDEMVLKLVAKEEDVKALNAP